MADKPNVTTWKDIPIISLQQYERYLPSAFDEELTLLQKLNKVIKYLDDIGVLLNGIGTQWNQIVDWVMGAGLEDAVNAKLTEWLNDGTLQTIIDAVLNGLVDDLQAQIDELKNAENVFDYTAVEPEIVTHLNGIRNAVNQSIAIDPKTREIYTTQSDSLSPEGFYINRLTPAGEYVSSMLINQGGHGTQIAIERLTDAGGNLMIWFYHTGKGKLVCIPYQDNAVITTTQATAFTDYTPASLVGRYFTPTYDPYFDRIALRQDAGRVEIRKRSDIVGGIDTVLYYADIDPTENDPVNRPMQGSVTYDSTIYWQSGLSSSVMRISKYDGVAHTKVSTQDINVLAQDGMDEFRDSFHEPEGLTYFVHPKTGKHSLLFALTTGGMGKRFSLLYALNQKNASDYWQSIRNLSAPSYSPTKGMRALSVEDGTTSLAILTKYGTFYIDNTTAKGFTDFPYPVGDAGWWLYVSPMNQTFTCTQTLVRSSSTNKILILERVVTFDRTNFSYSFGDWTVIQSGNRHAENIEPADWANKISNINLPQEYYLSTADMVAMTDAPYTDAGARLIVHPADSDNRILQEIIRNSDSVMERYARNVNSDGTANAWYFKRMTGGLSYTNVAPSGGVTNADGTSLFRVGDDGGNLITRGALTVPATITTVTTFATLPTDKRPTARWDYEQKQCTFSFLSDGSVQVVNNSGADQTIRLGCIIPKG